jgi:hypothetical protein
MAQLHTQEVLKTTTNNMKDNDYTNDATRKQQPELMSTITDIQAIMAYCCEIYTKQTGKPIKSKSLILSESVQFEPENGFILNISINSEVFVTITESSPFITHDAIKIRMLGDCQRIKREEEGK